MGLLSSLNPVNIIRDGIESITGVADQRSAINAASAAQRDSILQAITGLQEGGNAAASFLTGGSQRAGDIFSGGAGAATSLLTGGADAARNLISGGGAFDAAEFGQGLTLQGFGQQLGQIADPSGAFAPLFQERQRAATSALSSAGLTRSGNAAEAAAEIPLSLALGISNTLFGRQSGTAANLANIEQGLAGNLANIEQGLAGNLAGIETSLSGNLANLETSEAANIANLNVGAGQVEADRIQAQASIADPFSSLITGALGQFGGSALSSLFGAGGAAGAGAAAGGAISGGITSLLGLFSDERLKTNMKIIGRDGDLTFYHWDWIDEIKELDLPMMNVGLIAQDVEKIAPEYVFQVGEIKAIDYDNLLKDERWLTSLPQ